MISKKIYNKHVKGPVSVEDHYELFKDIEAKFKDQLAQQEQDYLLIGLRVAYDVLESSIAEPGEFPHSVEFGYLEEFDEKDPERLESSDEEIYAAFKNSPIPLEMLEEAYNFAKIRLEELAQTSLAVGLHVEYKTLMSVRSTGISCYCRGKGKKWVKAPGSSVGGCKLGC